MTVCVLIPAFNEATVIGEVIADVRSVFGYVVCVDDGSTDDTGEIARRAGAHLVRHPVNLGQGAAIQTGIEYARKQPGARVFATFDADGQHRVKDVATMIDRGPGASFRWTLHTSDAHGLYERFGFTRIDDGAATATVAPRAIWSKAGRSAAYCTRGILEPCNRHAPELALHSLLLSVI